MLAEAPSRILTPTRRSFEERTSAVDRKFLVVSLGGTIIQHRKRAGAKLEPHPEPLKLFRRLTTIHKMAALDFRLVANVDSTNMESPYWMQTAQVIAEEQDNYDGILVTHGTDTMAHTAAALRFLLGDHLRVPVVVTGSQMPLIGGDSSDARPNLGDSIQTLVAARNAEVNEVMIVFGRRILRGNRANKESELDYAAFRSPAFPDLAPLNAGPLDFTSAVLASRVDLSGIAPDAPLPPIEITDGFAETPLELSMNPDFKLMPSIIEALRRGDYPALVMKSFGAGNIPDKVIPSIRELSDMGIPVLVGASHPGAGMNSEYAVGDAPIKAGAVPTGNMLINTALIKLRILQNRGLNLGEIKREMPRSYYGEVG